MTAVRTLRMTAVRTLCMTIATERFVLKKIYPCHAWYRGAVDHSSVFLFHSKKQLQVMGPGHCREYCSEIQQEDNPTIEIAVATIK